VIINDDQLSMHHARLKFMHLYTCGYQALQQGLCHGLADRHVGVIPWDQHLNADAAFSRIHQGLNHGTIRDEIGVRDEDGLLGGLDG
jgi:hypothetical protein